MSSPHSAKTMIRMPMSAHGPNDSRMCWGSSQSGPSIGRIGRE